jgi:hypothetical protein
VRQEPAKKDWIHEQKQRSSLEDQVRSPPRSPRSADARGGDHGRPQGLSEELDQQAEIAAALMGLPYDEVHAALLKTASPRKDVKTSVVFTGPASAPRTIVVERKPSRRVVGAVDRPQRTAMSSAG